MPGELQPEPQRISGPNDPFRAPFGEPKDPYSQNPISNPNETDIVHKTADAEPEAPVIPETETSSPPPPPNGNGSGFDNGDGDDPNVSPKEDFNKEAVDTDIDPEFLAGNMAIEELPEAKIVESIETDAIVVPENYDNEYITDAANYDNEYITDAANKAKSILKKDGIKTPPRDTFDIVNTAEGGDVKQIQEHIIPSVYPDAPKTPDLNIIPSVYPDAPKTPDLNIIPSVYPDAPKTPDLNIIPSVYPDASKTPDLNIIPSVYPDAPKTPDEEKAKDLLAQEIARDEETAYKVKPLMDEALSWEEAARSRLSEEVEEVEEGASYDPTEDTIAENETIADGFMNSAQWLRDEANRRIEDEEAEKAKSLLDAQIAGLPEYEAEEQEEEQEYDEDPGQTEVAVDPALINDLNGHYEEQKIINQFDPDPKIVNQLPGDKSPE